MNGKQVSNLVVAAALAGGLFAGSVGWTAAQDQPAGGDPHQHRAGTPAAGSRSGAPDDAMTSMVRDMMEDMMPGMMAEMMPGMMGDMQTDMMDRMMVCMMGDMRGGGMMGGMEDDDMPGGMSRDQQADRDGFRAMGGMTDEQHARMQTVVAEALGLTVDELETELADGKSVRAIAEEQGVDLTDVHEAVMDELGLATR